MDDKTRTEIVFDYSLGDDIRKDLRASVDSSMRDSARGLYAQQQMIGISDIGDCREYVRRMILGEPWVDEQDDYAAAFVGTAVGDLVERAVQGWSLSHNRVTTQVDVTIEIGLRGHSFTLPGHADVVVDNTCIDIKTKDGLGVVRRTGPTKQQMFQVTLYTAALIAAGEIEEKDAVCAVAFFDRSGREPDPEVFAWEFSDMLFAEVLEWIDDVLYAIEQGEEASKDKPRQWCFECCPYATACRGRDTDVTGLLEDPEVLEAVAVYRESQEIIKAAEKDKKSAASVLDRVDGSTGEFTIRHVEVAPTEVPSHVRQGYRRLDIRPIKRSKS